jgi:hypothetical protein
MKGLGRRNGKEVVERRIGKQRIGKERELKSRKKETGWYGEER